MTFAQALEAYRRGDLERNKPMAQFCGVSYRTALEWGRKRDPVGEVLNKLIYFLDAHGIRVDREVDPSIDYIGQLVAFGVMKAEEAQQLLGLSGKLSHVWTALQGKSTPYVIKKGELPLLMLQDHYGLLLDMTLTDAVEKGLIPKSALPAEAVSPLAKPAKALPSAGISVGSHITVAAAFIGGLAVLGQRIVLEGEAAIEALRAEIADDTFYTALDSLKAMSSRKAREFYHGKR